MNDNKSQLDNKSSPAKGKGAMNSNLQAPKIPPTT